MAEASDAAPRCPICGRPTVAALRPFCSRRCADIDLGRWFGGQYRTPSRRIDDEHDDARPPDQGEDAS